MVPELYDVAILVASDQFCSSIAWAVLIARPMLLALLLSARLSSLRIRQLEQDLVHMQSQRRDWPSDAGKMQVLGFTGEGLGFGLHLDSGAEIPTVRSKQKDHIVLRCFYDVPGLTEFNRCSNDRRCWRHVQRSPCVYLDSGGTLSR